MLADYDYLKKVRYLIQNYIIPAGVTNKKVLSAIKNTPRHLFVPNSLKEDAYLDIALSIGQGQTISQPSLVGLMTQALTLKGNENVLEIGTGSGYQTAILSKLAKKVYTVEVIKELAESARQRLFQLGCRNVQVININGSKGLKSHAPYDAIIATAAPKSIPTHLVTQLKENGRIVIPVGESPENQILKLGIKKNSKLEVEDLLSVSFVPLI